MNLLRATRFHYPDKLSWYENTDGRGAFGLEQNIFITSDGAILAFDAVTSSRTRLAHWRADLTRDMGRGLLDEIAWFENTPPQPPIAVNIYGCGVNPAGSISVLSGVPSLGATVVLGLDNPLGTQAVGSIPFLVLVLSPDANFPCGTSIPNSGMGGAGARGELLISLEPPTPIVRVLVGPPWRGARTPSPISVAIPNDLTLLGSSVFAQGLMLDPTAEFGVKFGLTDAVELRVGP